jgi:hypothetical protein
LVRVSVVIVAALLAMFWWVSRRADIAPSIEQRPAENQESSKPIVEPIRTETDEPGSAPESKPLRTEPNIVTLITGRPLPDVESPLWSDEMETAILSHIGRHPGLKLTNLQVQCAEDGCLILLIGRDIPVYELDFDVFATEHGFSAALIRGDGIQDRTVFLRR